MHNRLNMSCLADSESESFTIVSFTHRPVQEEKAARLLNCSILLNKMYLYFVCKNHFFKKKYNIEGKSE